MKLNWLRLFLLLASIFINFLALSAVKLSSQDNLRERASPLRLVSLKEKETSIPKPESFEPKKPAVKKLVNDAQKPAVKPKLTEPLETQPSKGDEESSAEQKEGSGELVFPGSNGGSSVDGNDSGNGEGTIPTPKPFSDDEIKEALANYREILFAKINANKEYPVIAKRLGHQGKVKLSFTINSDGKLLSSSVIVSSGFSELDESALAAAKKANPFPPFPKEITEKTKEFSVVINFELK